MEFDDDHNYLYKISIKRPSKKAVMHSDALPIELIETYLNKIRLTFNIGGAELHKHDTQLIRKVVTEGLDPKLIELLSSDELGIGFLLGIATTVIESANGDNEEDKEED